MRLTLSAIFALAAGMASAEGTLNLYNWGDYTSPELLAKSRSREPSVGVAFLRSEGQPLLE